MENRLSLIKTDYKETEKRIFPRFPFSYLTFKGEQSGSKTFEVKDISFTGMQLSLRDGGHEYTNGQEIEGDLHWKSAQLKVKGQVQWVKGARLGVHFNEDKNMSQEIRQFLSIDNIMKSMKALHLSTLDVELPQNLDAWLQADGPVEVFIWNHSDSEVAQFQIIMLDSFVEYEDGKGLRSGSVMTKRDLDTPLVKEDEFVFQIDDSLDNEKLNFAQEIINAVPEHFLTDAARTFLKMKLRITTN